MFIFLPLAIGLLTTGPAHAADEASVLVAPFEATQREASGLAALLPGFLAQELAAHPELDAITIDEVPPISGMSARIYSESCPPAEFVGCGFVLGEAVGADYAIAGIVRLVDDTTRVEVHIIDVLEAEDVLSFQADLGTGDDEVFAQGVARVLVAVVRGEAGGQRDIRDGEPVPEDPNDNLAISRQLDQLSREIGDVTTLSRRTSQEIARPQLTAADIAERMETEGSKPWERLDMGPSEYLRYKNSGMTLIDWRNRSRGRQGHLILRGQAGFASGGYGGKYYGRYAEDDDLQVVETYAWQSVTTGGGATLSGSVSYGLSPALEAGIGVGLVTGRYEVDADKITVGSNFQEQPSYEEANQSLQIWGQVLISPLPTANTRPVVGALVSYTRGTAVGDHIILPAELPTWTAPNTLVSAGLLLGGEFRLSSRVDAFAHLPITMGVGGHTSDTMASGGGGLNTKEPVPGMPGVQGALLFGIQVKLLGDMDSAKVGLNDFEEPL